MTGWLEGHITRSEVLLAVLTWFACDWLTALFGIGRAMAVAGAVLCGLLVFFWWAGRRNKQEAPHV